MIDHAVILAAHGGGDGSPANRIITELAGRIEGPDIDAVVPAFHQGTPGFAEVLDRVGARRYTVVPVMTSAGYYGTVVLPRALALNTSYDARRVRLTPPLGAHPRLGDVLARRARQLATDQAFDPAHTAVVIVGHGTPRHARSRHTAQVLARRVQDRTGLRSVAVFIDDEPALGELGAVVDQRHLVILPLLVGGGDHAAVDLAAQLVDDRLAGRRMITDVPLGMLPEIAELIADLAAAPRRLRLAVRSSRLALVQAARVAEPLRAAGHPVDIITVETGGDRDRDRPIAELDGPAPFADDIERMLLTGRADIAVHSLKDLAADPPGELTLAAILERGDPGESLVARHGLTLEGLPAGARVGTSSRRRAAQLRLRRPDLIIAPLRGPVDDRVHQVLDGALDAAILATAGLRRLDLIDVATEHFAPTAFVPAPAQGAIAVQTRADDRAAQAALATLDHAPTRTAITVELDLAARFAECDDRPLAAYAICTDTITLCARVLEPDGSACIDITVAGDTPGAVVAAALNRLQPVPSDTNGRST